VTEGTTKTDWFTLCYPLTNAPGKEEKIARPLGCKKEKKENEPMINDSNCSKLIEYIIHRHPSQPTIPAAISTSSMVNDTQFGYRLCPLVCYHPPHPTVFMKHRGRSPVGARLSSAAVLHNLCLYQTNTHIFAVHRPLSMCPLSRLALFIIPLRMYNNYCLCEGEDLRYQIQW